MIIKMYSIFARETLKKMLYEGKFGAQAQHCTLHAWWNAEDRTHPDNEETPDFLGYEYYTNVMQPYREGMDARKICLVVDTVAELEELYEEFRPYMGATLVEDCAYTVFTENTITGVGLGPIQSDWTKSTRLADLETLRNEIHAE